jgi:hypothetical protein
VLLLHLVVQMLYDMMMTDDHVAKEQLEYLSNHTPVTDAGGATGGAASDLTRGAACHLSASQCL